MIDVITGRGALHTTAGAQMLTALALPSVFLDDIVKPLKAFHPRLQAPPLFDRPGWRHGGEEPLPAPPTATAWPADPPGAPQPAVASLPTTSAAWMMLGQQD